MKKTEPFLFKFKKECVGPRKAVMLEDYKYDYERDIMLCFENGAWIPALKSTKRRRTKKNDIEKGEDKKDRRIWR